MTGMRKTIGVLGFSLFLAGCGGSAAPPTAEQKAPDYGTKSMDQMKGMMGVPTSKGMAPAKPAAGK
jgi:PBP1b-binding outer membrane lipoprotein LpoB